MAFADKGGRPPIEIDDFPEGAWLLKKAAELAVQDSAPKPIMLGRPLVELGVKPGPQFGKILDRCYDAQLEGEFTDSESGRIYLKSIVES